MNSPIPEITKNRHLTDPAYIGDGVYIAKDLVDGIIIWTERADGDHYIHFDQETINSMIKYLYSRSSNAYREQMKAAME